MLFTRCPDCETTFKITAEALRKADGQVRCGRCASVFNAYTELRRRTRDAYGDDGVVQLPIEPAEAFTHEREATEQEKEAPAAGRRKSSLEAFPESLEALQENSLDVLQQSSAAAAERQTIGTEPHADNEAAKIVAPEGADVEKPTPAPTHDDDRELIVSMLEDSGVITATLLRTRAARVDDAAVYEELSLESVIEELEASTVPDEPDPQLIDSPIEPAALAGVSTPHEPDDRPVSRQPVPPPAQARRGSASAAKDAAASPTWVILENEPKSRAPRAWAVGAAAAALLLAVQVTHHFRSQIATTAVVGPWLQEAYAVLGNEIAPRWDLAQYEIVDWTAIAEPSASGQGSLKIAAQVLNRGPRPQPLPHVHVLLKDRWESTVGSRVFSPAEYLQAEPAADAWMRAGMTARAELDIVDPGPDAYGFELDLCIAANDGALRCAADDVFR
jgi:predicted Zn finger-like uncharacterized protein